MRRKKKTFLPECFIRTIKCKRQIMLMSRRVKVDMNWTHLLQTFQYNNGVLYLVEGRLLFLCSFFSFHSDQTNSWRRMADARFMPVSHCKREQSVSSAQVLSLSGSTYAAQIDLSFLSSYFFFFLLKARGNCLLCCFLTCNSLFFISYVDPKELFASQGL